MKLATVRHLQEARYDARNLLKLSSTGLLLLPYPGNGPQKALSIWMKGLPKEVFHWSFLHHFACIHYQDPLCHLRNETQVVSDQDNGCLEFLFEALHQVYDLGLDGYIQGSRGLIR
jgi:hypothetical protein